MNFTNRLAAAFAAVILLSAGAMAQQKCDRHTEPAGGFSMCMPDGWTKVLRDGRKFHNLHAPATFDFRTNINFKDDPTTLPLASYVTQTEAYLKSSTLDEGAEPTRVESRTPFTTASGLKGFRLITTTKIGDTTYRFLQYYFKPPRPEVLFITCTSLDKEKAEWDPVCNKAAASFKLETKPAGRK